MFDIDMLDLTVKRQRTTDGGFTFVARYPEISVMAQGDTVSQALANLTAATNDIIAHLKEHNIPIESVYRPYHLHSTRSPV